MKRSKRIYVRIVIVLLCLLAVLESYQLITESTAITSFAANVILRNNFHEVIPGRFYRSAKMQKDELLKTLKKNHIKTLIDLQMGKPEPYPDGTLEPEIVKSLGVKYVHFPIVGSKMPTSEQLQNLIQIFDSVTEPILVQCSSGTHRSGVAAAIWLLTTGNSSIDHAAKMLSARYGFFWFERKLKSLITGERTIDNLIWDFAQVSKISNISFRHWAKEGHVERRDGA